MTALRRHLPWLFFLLLLSLAGVALAQADTDPQQPAPATSGSSPTEPEPEKPAPTGPPRFDGERMIYEFGWNGIAAAQADITIDVEPYNGKTCYHAVMTIETKAALDLLWKVRDRIEAYAEVGTLEPQYYSFRQREGNFHHDTDIIFDHNRKVATSIRQYKGKIKKTVVAFEEMYDPVTTLLVMRNADLQPGRSRQIVTFDGKRVHTIQYEAMAKDSIDTPFGRKETVKVFPEIIKTEPPKKVKKGEADKAAKVQKVFYWIDPGSHAWIYHVESEVTVGRIYAKLIER